MGKIDENKKKKKEALFNTAYELFTTKGITSTTVSYTHLICVALFIL